MLDQTLLIPKQRVIGRLARTPNKLGQSHENIRYQTDINSVTMSSILITLTRNTAFKNGLHQH